MLNIAESVCHTSWPAFTPFDKLVRKQYVFFRDFLKNARQAAIKSKVNGPKSVIVYLANTFEEKKIVLLRWMATICDKDGGFPEDLLKRMKDFVEGDGDLKKDTKLLMQFGAFMRDEAKERGIDALAEVAPFDQMAILNVLHFQRFTKRIKIFTMIVLGKCRFHSEVIGADGFGLLLR